MTNELHCSGSRMAGFWVAVLVCLPLAASDESEEKADDGQLSDGGEDHDLEEVVVYGHPLGGAVSQSTDILAGEELERAARQSVGETLAQTPGVHSASYGPAVGHPVIHGLTGTRVLVLENHVSSMDVSSSGSDHSIAVEPFLADRIEVIKGSGTLLYGSGAMGGTVDVHTSRVPADAPEGGLSGRFLGRGDTGSDARYAGFRLDGGGGEWAWHLDGYTSENADLAIPGFALLDAHDEEEEEEEEHHEGEEEEEEDHEEPVAGVLENSFGDHSGGAFGTAYHGARGHFGVAVAVRDWSYGIVGAHAHGEEGHGEEEEEEHHGDEEEEELEGDHDEEEGEHDEENPWAAVEQTKFVTEFGLLDPFPGFTSLEGSVVISDYEHNEIEGDEGEVASHFGNDAWQVRVVMEAEPRGTWESAVGVQLGGSDFVFGSEGEFEPVESSHWAIFGVAHTELDQFELETGARLESVEHVDTNGLALDFLATSVSVGVVVPNGPWEFTARVDRSMCAPEGEELFAAGAHLAIGGFQMGSAELDEEQSLNLTAGAAYRSEGVELKLTGYRYGFDNFIYQRETADEHDELTVFQWSQTEATFLGLDAEARVQLFADAQATADLVFGYDWVTTDVDDPHLSHLPRIPPRRASIAAEVAWHDLWGRIAYSRYADQDEVTTYETPTDGYGNLDIEGEYAARLGEANLVFFVAGRNLGDEDQRQHSSFVKYSAPLAGRRVEAGVRIWF